MDTCILRNKIVIYFAKVINTKSHKVKTFPNNVTLNCHVPRYCRVACVFQEGIHDTFISRSNPILF